MQGSFEELCAAAERRGQRVELGVGKVRHKTKYRDNSRGSWRSVENVRVLDRAGKVVAESKLNGLGDLERAAKSLLSIS